MNASDAAAEKSSPISTRIPFELRGRDATSVVAAGIIEADVLSPPDVIWLKDTDTLYHLVSPGRINVYIESVLAEVSFA